MAKYGAGNKEHKAAMKAEYQEALEQWRKRTLWGFLIVRYRFAENMTRFEDCPPRFAECWEVFLL
jgi:hypothetical protein